MQETRFYSVVNPNKQDIIIEQLNLLPKPLPWFYFNPINKLEKLSNVPTSNTDNTFLPINRTVFLFETIFTDETIYELAQENSEWWWSADELTGSE